MDSERDILDARQAADLLQIHEETLRRLAREGKIPAFKVGGVWRFKRSFLHAWADQNQIVERPEIKVLVIDDDESVLRIVGQTIEAAGWKPLLASSGTEALELMAGDTPDAILLDLKMPDMDGPTTLKNIRDIYGDIAVIILTAYPESDLMARALEYGPITLLSKPIEMTLLVKTIASAINGILDDQSESSVATYQR